MRLPFVVFFLGLPGVREWTARQDTVWNAVVNSVCGLLGIADPVTVALNSSSDRLGHWLQLACMLVFAAIATLCWSILDRSPHHRRGFELLRAALRCAGISPSSS
jgi:hypothetical protein